MGMKELKADFMGGGVWEELFKINPEKPEARAKRDEESAAARRVVDGELKAKKGGKKKSKAKARAARDAKVDAASRRVAAATAELNSAKLEP